MRKVAGTGDWSSIPFGGHLANYSGGTAPDLHRISFSARLVRGIADLDKPPAGVHDSIVNNPTIAITHNFVNRTFFQHQAKSRRDKPDAAAQGAHSLAPSVRDEIPRSNARAASVPGPGRGLDPRASGLCYVELACRFESAGCFEFLDSSCCRAIGSFLGLFWRLNDFRVCQR